MGKKKNGTCVTVGTGMGILCREEGRVELGCFPLILDHVMTFPTFVIMFCFV